MKTIITILLLFLCVGTATAGDIVSGNGTVVIYGEVEDRVFMSGAVHTANREAVNFNRTVCDNATVIEGEISIGGKDPYELEYIFIADINDSTYVTRLLTIKQEVVSSGLLSGCTLKRTLTLDGIEISSYETTTSWWGKTKKNTVYFDLIDSNIRFGDMVVRNVHLAFTQLNYIDQQNYLKNKTAVVPRYPISHKYISVGEDGSEGSLELTGLTGVVYNMFGESILTSIPIVGGAIGNFCNAVQGLIFLPLSILQFSFDIIFTFVIMIKNNWWYSLLLLEIICIMKSLKYHRYPDIVGKYFDTHVVIFKFMWEVVVLNLVRLIVRLIEVVRNLFRI